MATPFTSQVTEVVVEVVEFARLTTAVNVVDVFKGTVMEVGVIDTDVTVVLPLLPPPQPATAQASKINQDTPGCKRALASERRADPRGS